ncbi:MAG: hypothetical protein ACYTF6_14630 [Planctomycetota bacterium]|jgi:hypothetical protein
MDYRFTDQVPDSTYFRRGDAEPTVEKDTVVLLDGQGTRRSSWGAPQVNSTVIVDECDFLAVLVGFSHKHGGGQFYRYYMNGTGGIKQLQWQQLTDDERALVLEAYKEKAPYWAKSPGKLRSEYAKPTLTTFVGYKIMRVVDDSHFLSLYDDTEWEIGKRNGQAVGANAGRWDYTDQVVHDGGYYVHTDAEAIQTLFDERRLVPGRCYDEDAAYALVECECSGRTAHFSSGKIACTYVKPVKVVRTFALS